MHSSHNEQDSRHYAVAAKLPMFEPSDSGDCVMFTKAAFELSERYDTPVLLRMSTRVSHSQSLISTGRRNEVSPRSYEKNIAKIMMPVRQKKRPTSSVRRNARAALAAFRGNLPG